MISFVLAAACIALCFYAAMKDIVSLTIPNWVNASIAGLGVVALLVSGLPLSTVGWHLLLGVGALVVCMALFFVGAFGGGDAKMIPAVLIWAGPSAAFPFIMWTAVFGGVLALALLPLRNFTTEGFVGARHFASLEQGAGAPYAVAIAAGLFFTLERSPLLAVIGGQLG